MRYLRDIQHPTHKISLYQWNGKYIVKIEAGGMYEQLYKLDQTEVSSEEEVDRIFDEAFAASVVRRFAEMHRDFSDSLRRNGILF